MERQAEVTVDATQLPCVLSTNNYTPTSHSLLRTVTLTHSHAPHPHTHTLSLTLSRTPPHHTHSNKLIIKSNGNLTLTLMRTNNYTNKLNAIRAPTSYHHTHTLTLTLTHAPHHHTPTLSTTS